MPSTNPVISRISVRMARIAPVQVAAVLHWLRENQGWLLIVDGVDTEDTAEEVELFRAKLRGGHVLITSRLARWDNFVEPLELGVLSSK